MATQYFQWEDTFSAALTNLNGASIAGGGETQQGGSISNDEKWSTELGVSISYGSTAPEAVEVRIYGETDDGTFATEPTATYVVPANPSTVEGQRFEVPGTMSVFKVGVFNPSANGSVTATVKPKQATLESV